MAYEWEDIRASQEIFYHLLECRQLREEDEPLLYQAYTQREEVQNLVKSQGEAADSMIERYGNVVYLIPKEENNLLGYSKAQLKAVLCRSGATDKDFYLSQFVVLTLLVEFYDGQGSSSKTRDYIRVGELQNILSQRLKEGRRTGRKRRNGRGSHLQICWKRMKPCVQTTKVPGPGRRKKDSCTISWSFSRDRGLWIMWNGMR